MSGAILTLAIPTYRRRETVLRSVDAASSLLRGLPVIILVADNASDDGTAAALLGREAHPEGPRLDIIVGERNTGVLGNFLRLVDHCTTDYLLLLSDEDEPAGRDVIVQLLERLEHEAPDVLVASPGVLGPEERRSDDIAPEDFWDALNLLSGPVYRTETLRRSADAVRALATVAPIDGIWNLWPFYLVAVDTRIAGGICRWHPERLAVQREDLPTVVEDALFPTTTTTPPPGATGRSADPRRARYKTLEARLVQSEALAHYLVAREHDAARPLDTAGHRVLAEFRRISAARLFPTVAKRIRDDHPLLADAFVKGAREAYGSRALLRDLIAPLRGRGLRSVWRRSTR